MTNQEIIRQAKNEITDYLYFAAEQQIVKLIDQGELNEDDYARWDNAQEEMRCMMAEFSA